jgi:type I restriction enzyme S subunit
MEKVKKYRVGNICNINASTLSKNDNFERICYLDTANITKNKIDAIQDIAVLEAPSRAQRKVKNNTIVYSTVRPNLEHFGILENPKTNFIVSTGFSTLDVIDENINPKYLYYLLTQQHITNYLHTIATNAVSAYPSINSDDISNLIFSIPDFPSQTAIASALSLLDNKIVLNSKINDNLPTPVRSLAWVVTNHVAT